MKQLLFFFLCTLTVFNCGVQCETISYSFPVSVVDNIPQDKLAIGDELLVEIEIPHIITDDNGDQFNIEEEMFQIGVSFQRFVRDIECDQRNPYQHYGDAIEDFNINVTEGLESEQLPGFPIFNSTADPTSKIFNPQINENNRTLKLSLQPTIRDTFVIHFVSSRWDTNRENKNCYDLNTIAFQNPIKGLESEIKNQFRQTSLKLLEIAPDNIVADVYDQYDGGILIIVD